MRYYFWLPSLLPYMPCRPTILTSNLTLLASNLLKTPVLHSLACMSLPIDLFWTACKKSLSQGLHNSAAPLRTLSDTLSGPITLDVFIFLALKNSLPPLLKREFYLCVLLSSIEAKSSSNDVCLFTHSWILPVLCWYCSKCLSTENTLNSFLDCVCGGVGGCSNQTTTTIMVIVTL